MAQLDRGGEEDTEEKMVPRLREKGGTSACYRKGIGNAKQPNSQRRDFRPDWRTNIASRKLIGNNQVNVKIRERELTNGGKGGSQRCCLGTYHPRDGVLNSSIFEGKKRKRGNGRGRGGRKRTRINTPNRASLGRKESESSSFKFSTGH